MEQKFYDAMADCPVIAAVKNFEKMGLQPVVMRTGELSFSGRNGSGSVSSTSPNRQIKEAGKIALVHIDLVEGLSAHEVSVDYIRKNTKADGIISTRMNMINRARELSMYTVFRIFILDSRAFQGIEKQKRQVKADFIEILPGVMPKIIQKVNKLSAQAVIAGGLINDNVIEALNAGAISVSTTNQDIWFM